MIEYVEIRDLTLAVVGIIDDAKSIIWEIEYYGAGAFEIYAPFTAHNYDLLKTGYYVTRQDEVNAAIIEQVRYRYSQQDGQMIIASGRMLKSILDRRIINRIDGSENSATRVSGSLVSAVRGLIQKHAGINAGVRNMGVLFGNTGGISIDIPVRQTTFGELLTFTDDLLHEFGCGAFMWIRRTNPAFIYELYQGRDKSIGNTSSNEPVIFSQDFDNLVSSEYDIDISNDKNAALVGGEGQGIDRFYVYSSYTTSTGLDLKEMWVDASSLARSYNDDEGEQHTYTDDQYSLLLYNQGLAQTKMQKPTETITGEINLTYSPYSFGQGKDFWLGDIVTIDDIILGQRVDVRIIKATEVQDESGYSLSVEYGNKED